MYFRTQYLYVVSNFLLPHQVKLILGWREDQWFFFIWSFLAYKWSALAIVASSRVSLTILEFHLFLLLGLRSVSFIPNSLYILILLHLWWIFWCILAGGNSGIKFQQGLSTGSLPTFLLSSEAGSVCCILRTHAQIIHSFHICQPYLFWIPSAKRLWSPLSNTLSCDISRTCIQISHISLGNTFTL